MPGIAALNRNPLPQSLNPSLRSLIRQVGSRHCLVMCNSDLLCGRRYHIQALLRHGDNCHFISSGESWLTSVLNAPVGWHFAWRRAQHGKDEALRYFTSFVENYPVPARPDLTAVDETVAGIEANCLRRSQSNSAILDWLLHEFGLERPGQVLAVPEKLDVTAFVDALARPCRNRVSCRPPTSHG